MITATGSARLGGAVLMHGDITARKLAEEALRESEARFRGTFEQAAVGLAHIALAGRFLRVNDKLCAITGYPRGELLGLTFADLTVSEDHAAGEEARRALLDGEQVSYTRKSATGARAGSWSGSSW